MTTEKEPSKNTLMTLAIVCYNFEKYIGEALDGAFAQTYSPLEILISDDCSKDHTWEIVQKKVADYHGSHRITLNRNPVNLGLARHENRVFELAQSEWIVFQSGDDVSMPNRVERVAQVITRNPSLRCIHCRCQIIDSNGRVAVLPRHIIGKAKYKPESFRVPEILGAGAVYHRDTYSFFGPLGSHVLNEDHVLPLRAHLLGGIHFVDDELVKYRKHSTNLSGNDVFCVPQKEEIARYRKGVMISYYQQLMDLQWLEYKKPERIKETARYKRLVQDDIVIADMLSRWTLNPEFRMRLLFSVVTCPGVFWLAIRRIFYRLLRVVKGMK